LGKNPPFRAILDNSKPHHHVGFTECNYVQIEYSESVWASAASNTVKQRV